MRIIPTITVTPYAVIPSRLLSAEFASHISILRYCMTIISIIIRNVTTVRIPHPPVYSALPSQQKHSVVLVFAKFSPEPCYPERQVDKGFRSTHAEFLLFLYTFCIRQSILPNVLRDFCKIQEYFLAGSTFQPTVP